MPVYSWLRYFCSGTSGGQLDAFITVASPGGAVVTVNGQVADSGGGATDTVGVSAWFDWTKVIPSRVYDVSALIQPGQYNELTVSIGCGCWCPSAVPTMEHSGRTIHTQAGAQPLVKYLLTVTVPAPNPTNNKVVAQIASGVNINTVVPTSKDQITSESRRGPLLNSSSWLGMVYDWGLSDQDDWSSPPRLVPNDTVQLDLPRNHTVRPLSQPPMNVFVKVVPVSATQAQTLDQTQTAVVNATLFKFPTMIVGTASIPANAWGGSGSIQLEYCEFLQTSSSVMNTGKQTNTVSCVRQGGYEATGTVDVHKIDATSHNNNFSLTGLFAWRGFQYVLVTTRDGAWFRGQLTDLQGQWTGLQLEKASKISFSVNGNNAVSGVEHNTEGNVNNAADVLANLTDLTARGFRSNLLTGLPTDCPTR